MMTRNPPRRAGKDEPYEVGYGKPPKHTQFKPGQSGNTKAGPAGSVILEPQSGMLCKEKVTIREGERTRSVSRMDAIIRVTFNNALRSDAKALAAFIELARSAGLMDQEPEPSSAESAVPGRGHSRGIPRAPWTEAALGCANRSRRPLRTRQRKKKNRRINHDWQKQWSANAAVPDRRDLPRRLLFVRAADLPDRIGGQSVPP